MAGKHTVIPFSTKEKKGLEALVDEIFS